MTETVILEAMELLSDTFKRHQAASRKLEPTLLALAIYTVSLARTAEQQKMLADVLTAVAEQCAHEAGTVAWPGVIGERS